MHINIRKFIYDECEEYQRFVSDYELKQAARFKYTYGRERYILAKAWTREYLSEVLDLAPADIRIAKTTAGKPYLKDYPDVFFNISHSEDYFAVIVNEGQDVGIDIEKIKFSENLDKLSEKAFGKREVECLKNIEDQRERGLLFYHLWTRREAVIKCLGKKMADHFKDDVLPCSTIVTEPRGCCSPFDQVQVFDRMDLLNEYAVAVAFMTN